MEEATAQFKGQREREREIKISEMQLDLLLYL